MAPNPLFTCEETESELCDDKVYWRYWALQHLARDPGVYNMSLVRGYVVGERISCMDKMDDMKMDE